MKQIVVTQDLSNRNNDNLTSVFTCGEDTAFMEDEPEQRRKCGETKVFFEEMKKQRKEVRALIEKQTKDAYS